MSNGMFKAPARIVIPAGEDQATPSGVTFGPTPNSVPPLVRIPASEAEARQDDASFSNPPNRRSIR